MVAFVMGAMLDAEWSGQSRASALGPPLKL